MIARAGVVNGVPCEQVVYYQTGVGTGPTNSLTGKIAASFEGAPTIPLRRVMYLC